MHVKNIFNLQYDYKFIFSGGCTSVLPDGGSLSVGVSLFVLSSAVLPNVSVFAFSVSKKIRECSSVSVNQLKTCIQRLVCTYIVCNVYRAYNCNKNN